MKTKNQAPLLADSTKLSISKNSTKLKKNQPGKALIAILDATHSGFVNENFFFYVPGAMKDSYHTWVTPYKRPILIHHRMSDIGAGATDPIGRVTDAHFIDDERGGFTQLEGLIPDEDAKQKIIDGRYLTVSTRVKPIEYVECTQCGANLLTDGFCGHPRGQIIEDEESKERKLTYWKIGRTAASEVSFVNLPADRTKDHYAGVTNWEFADSEHPDFTQAPELETHSGILVFDGEVLVPTQKHINQFLDTPNEDLIVNRSLWDSVEGKIKQYASMGGLLFATAPTSRSTTAAEPSATDAQKDPAEENPTTNENTAISSEPTDEELAALELTEDDLKIFDWLADEIAKEFAAQPRSRKLTNKVGERGKVSHSHVASLNQAGNGSTDYVLGHWHRVVDGRIWESISRGSEKGHGHTMVQDLKLPEHYIDSIEAHVTGYPSGKTSLKHRHVCFLNEAKNGDTDYPVGHSHEVVGGRILAATATGESKPHTHKLGEIFKLEDQWLDQETWDVVDITDAVMSEKAKKAASKAGKAFCGPQDKRKGRKSFPVTDCAHVRAGLRLLSRYKGPGDKSKIKACLKRQSTKLNCGVKASDENSYELLELLTVLLNDH